MNSVKCLLLLLFFSYANSESENRFERHTSTAQRIASHGYPAETHHVHTPDGYVLGVFRIPYSHKLQNQQEQRPVVFLFHGLFSCSDAFILTGPNSALAYNLADAGFDVWLGNARGNYYSRNSTRYSTKHPYFWRFTWHEIGYYDITSSIDYILEQTGEKAVHYIGHSQGTTTFMAALASQPAYNDKLKSVHLMAPVVYMSHVTDPMLKLLSQYLGHNGIYSALFGTQEFLPSNSLFMALDYRMCGENSPNIFLCSSAAVLLEGYAPNANKTIFPILAETHPAGASTDQIVHYMQSIKTGLFRRFDHDAKKNLQHYGQEEPPSYDISQVTAPISLYFSDNDNMAVTEDVYKLAAELPNVQKLHHVEDPSWAHADFTWATEAVNEINTPIIEDMLKFEQLIIQ